MRARLMLVTCALLATACGGSAKPRPTVALVVLGERAPDVEKAARDADLGVELRPVVPPKNAAAARPRASNVEQAITAARDDYLSGELARVRDCAEKLGAPDLVWSSLARRDRSAAARALVWRIACASIARKDEAVDAAKSFATLGLEPPREVDAIPVEAHRILSAALAAADTTPKRPLDVKSRVASALVVVDGRPSCTTPCTVEVLPGNHHVSVEKNGSTPSARVVHVGDAPRTEVSFDLAPASPELAAAQWAETYGTKPRADDSDALVLLSTALRAPRLVYLDSERLGDGSRVRGALVVNGRVDARDEEHGALGSSTHETLESLLVKGGIVESGSVFKKPLFWIAVGVGVAASSALTAYLLYDPGTRTEVRTR
jgi:hypothetical protein